MSFIKTHAIQKLFILILLTGLTACFSILHRNRIYMAPINAVQDSTYPKNCAILPFSNKTKETGIEILVRKSFYNYFSSKTYRDFELNEIDRILEFYDKKSSRSWRDLSAQEIGKLFHVDYLIIGRVMEFKRIFLGIYSQITLRVEIDLIDAKTGSILLSKNVLKRSHDGGLPFTPIDIIPAALRSSNLMQRDKTIELIDKTNRELVDIIPEPSGPPATPYFIEIQVASFLEDARAKKTLIEFQERGLNPRIETVTLENLEWHRVLLGPFFNVTDAEKAKEIVVKNTTYQPVFIHHH
ncbi:MAG: SPOR domain-containing protein [Deltaproteobacteria bacterium]|nr:SPOR domain-containing protein [Deltaproteobacteria bacterium]